MIEKWKWGQGVPPPLIFLDSRDLPRKLQMMMRKNGKGEGGTPPPYYLFGSRDLLVIGSSSHVT